MSLIDFMKNSIKRLELKQIRKHISVCVLLFLICIQGMIGEASYVDANFQWAGINGTMEFGTMPIYGTCGIPDSNNRPGCRKSPVSWIDSSNNLWLFGGYILDTHGTTGYLNDLWKYNRTTGNWTWMKGSSIVDQNGTYGTQGVPDSSNTPGARYGSVSWIDDSGALWLFGGYGFDQVHGEGRLNDLWKYDPSTGNWTWMKGSSLVNQNGTYGTQGVPDSSNTPGAREMAVSWKDSSGALWLFGGWGYDINILTGLTRLNDLWKYNPTAGNWIWMKGSSTGDQYGIYGTQGVPNPANTPGARYSSVSWIDSSGLLWLFGGWGNFDSSEHGSGCLNDLWKYDPTTENWTWMKGSSTESETGVYGTLGVPSSGNTPGSRYGSVSWIDGSDTLWLFGGNGYDSSEVAGHLNDLWKYSPGTGNWTWIKGSDTSSTMDNPIPGVYGEQGVSNPANNPGSRFWAVSWRDTSGELWLFGGDGYDSTGYRGSLNDLWKYNPTTGYWTWIKGGHTIQQCGIYGLLGVPDQANMPGARQNAVSWMQDSGMMWLFGGDGFDFQGNDGCLNDLWKYDPATGNWIWMKGASINSQSGVYGIKSIPDPPNTPGARYDAVSWIDSSGSLWLLGGWGYDKDSSLGYLNDLWKYIPTTGNWTWIKGASTFNQVGTYGTKGVPNIGNTPGGRYGSVSWIDDSGALWLFGGFGYGNIGEVGYLNDLWKYDPGTDNWTWMKGSDQISTLSDPIPGVYGTKGIPDPANTPGAREGAVSWTDASGSLWLLGGLGIDSTIFYGRLNDLWKYDPATGNWTWMKGSSTIDQSGIYGSLGIPAGSNTPGARRGAVSWTDASGELWLFGGWGHDNTGSEGSLNDLWKFDPLTGNWTWMKGFSTVFQSGTCEMIGVYDPSNIPGARYDAVSWNNRSTTLWLFGGYGYDCKGEQKSLGDQWRGDWIFSTANSTWIHYK